MRIIMLILYLFNPDWETHQYTVFLMCWNNDADIRTSNYYFHLIRWVSPVVEKDNLAGWIAGIARTKSTEGKSVGKKPRRIMDNRIPK